MEWEHLFEDHILERGWDYYENECRNTKKGRT